MRWSAPPRLKASPTVFEYCRAPSGWRSSTRYVPAAGSGRSTHCSGPLIVSGVTTPLASMTRTSISPGPSPSYRRRRSPARAFRVRAGVQAAPRTVTFTRVALRLAASASMRAAKVFFPRPSLLTRRVYVPGSRTPSKAVTQSLGASGARSVPMACPSGPISVKVVTTGAPPYCSSPTESGWR